MGGVIDPLALVRALHFAATVLAAGTIGFVVLVAEPSFAHTGTARLALAKLRRSANRLIWIALAVAIASGLAWLVLIAADIYGEPLTTVCLDGGLFTVLSGTRFGLVWIGRFVVAILMAAFIFWPATRYLQLIAAATLLAGLAFIGHAGATPGAFGDLHLVADIAHLLAAGSWLGGLPALATFLLIASQSRETVSRAVARFSLLGIVSVTALLVTGLINTWALVGAPRDLIETSYGRTLALKLGLFAAMLILAAINRFYLTPRLAIAGARTALARNSLAETALGAGILLLVGALGTMAPTRHMVSPPSNKAADAAFVHIHSSEAMANVTVTPGRVGEADAVIRVLREDFSEFPASDVHFSVQPPGSNAPSIDRAAVHQADGSWQVNGIEFGQPGNWTVQILLREQGGKPILLDAPIVIERTESR